MSDESPPRRRIGIFLWLLPLWLIVSAAGGIWLYYRNQAKEARVEQIRFTIRVSESGLHDDVGKFLGFIGERHVSSEAGQQGLTRAAAMIEGSLGPGNAGYAIERLRGPDRRWPILIVTLRGKDEDATPVWVVAGYDSRPGTPGAELNATGTVSTIAAASALANASPRRSVVFAFLPHAYDPEAPLLETFDILRQRAGKAGEMLVVESMGSSAELMVSTRDAENRALAVTGGLGEVVGAEAICLEDDFDLSSVLFEIGLPAVRVASRPVLRPDEADDGAPDPGLHAAATEGLVTLIGRLSDS